MLATVLIHCIRGCVHVLLLASMSVTIDDSLPVGVAGTTNLLKAAAQAKSIKRVVLTSSTVAVRGAAQPVNGTVYTEKDWNTTAKLEKGQLQGYQVSKVWRVFLLDLGLLCDLRPTGVC